MAGMQVQQGEAAGRQARRSSGLFSRAAYPVSVSFKRNIA